MKLGAVLIKERERAGMSAEATASELRLSPAEYGALESGASAAEQWGPILAKTAVALQTPTSRLLSPTGKAADSGRGHVGERIRGHRHRRGKSVEEVAAAAGLTTDSYRAVEAGESPLEEVGPALLRFAEAVGQPVFNLLYPCGLPLSDISDYPTDP